jgi:glycerophosphoryl diester phosphodiesterase
MLKIAHRGYSDKYGDNNMNSFKEALNAGFDMIELDIQLCGSGEVVIYHDTYIDKQYICDLDYDTLKKRNIILLDDFMLEFHDKNILLYFDLKGDYKVIFELIKSIKKWFKREQMKKIYISAFNRKFIDPLLEETLPVKIGFTTDNLFTIDQYDCIFKDCEFVCFHWTVLDEDVIKHLKSKNIQIFAYTNKDEFILNHILYYKVDGIVSDIKVNI